MTDTAKKETQRPQLSEQPCAAAEVSPWVFITLAVAEHVFDNLGDCARAFEHKLNECGDPEAMNTLWARNQPFRASVKEADAKRYLGMRQFFADMGGTEVDAG